VNSIEVPPDATVFRSGDLTPFLYFGAAEMIALQREWDLGRAADDTAESWAEKNKQFAARVYGDDWANRVTILRVCLSQWAAQSGHPVATDAECIRIIDRAEVAGAVYGEGKKFAGIYRINTLWQRLQFDMLGVNPEEEAEEAKPEETPDPKALGQASTPSETSSPQPSAGASPARKPTGSRRGRSASTSGRATRHAETS